MKLFQTFLLVMLLTSFARAEEEYYSSCSRSIKQWSLEEKQPCQFLTPTQCVNLFIQRAEYFWQMNKQIEAYDAAQKAVNLARTHVPEMLIHALNTQGNVLTQHKNYQEALKIYQEALTQNQEPRSHAQVFINLAQLWIEIGTHAGTKDKMLYHNNQEELSNKILEVLNHAQEKIDLLPDQEDKAVLILRFVQATLSVLGQQHLSQAHRTKLTERTYRFLTHFPAHSKLSARTRSYLKGYLGEWYHLQGRLDQALSSTRQALFFAQEVQADDILYVWEQQLGQFYQQQGEMQRATEAYRRALWHLNKVRSALIAMQQWGKQSFRESRIGQTYLQLNTLLLRQAAQSSSQDEQRQCFLNQAQEVIEQFKESELESYLRDACSIKWSRMREQKKSSPLEMDCSKTSVNINKDTALSNTEQYSDSNKERLFILYPIVYPDHIDLLLKSPEKTISFQVSVTRSHLNEAIDNFLVRLSSKNSDPRKILVYAQQLYQWLIQPVETYLDRVETLMVIPDEKLRALPFAALHDGQQYLFEKYPLATTINFTLTNVQQPSKPAKILLAGYPLEKPDSIDRRLEFAQEELKILRNVYQDADQLTDASFTKENFQHSMTAKLYDIIHLATHSQFEENPNKTGVETSDERIKLQDFQEFVDLNDFRGHSIELLTLSACETAQGNDRAALGLAGMTIKVGVKSVLASLWQVDDLSTCYLMEAFYKNFNQNMSKAKALQWAQKQLLHPPSIPYKSLCGTSSEDFTHPYYWSPFILIGNWK